jgi:hypothetical protein
VRLSWQLGRRVKGAGRCGLPGGSPQKCVGSLVRVCVRALIPALAELECVWVEWQCAFGLWSVLYELRTGCSGWFCQVCAESLNHGAC